MRCDTNVTHQSRPTLTELTEDSCASDLGWLASRSKLIQHTVVTQKAPDVQKAAGGHFKHVVLIDVTSINMSCFFTIIKTVSIFIARQHTAVDARY